MIWLTTDHSYQFASSVDLRIIKARPVLERMKINESKKGKIFENFGKNVKNLRIFWKRAFNILLEEVLQSEWFAIYNCFNSFILHPIQSIRIHKNLDTEVCANM